MCLYPKLIKNRKYTKNDKNGGVIPPILDKRVLAVPIGCGRCMECRKQKAREWQVRLLEDVRTNKNGKFITLTFSNESIAEINGIIEDRGGKEGYERDNEIATIAVRRWLERWRKEHKKSLRHWLVTELGHNGTENIHMHGIVWTDKEIKEVTKHWKYGYVWEGKGKEKENYVNERTVNYLIKYVTKMDKNHTEYKPKILTSAGLNPGLMYGMGGAGGTTTGSGGGGMPSGGSASDESSRQQAGTQNQMAMMQLALLGAQKENIEASTDKTKAETGKTGVDTEAGKFDLGVKKDTRGAIVDNIVYGAKEQIAKAEQEFNKGVISQATQQDEIKRIRAEAVGAGIENIVMQQGLKLSNAQIQKIGADIMQGWRKLEIEQQNATTGKRFANVAELTQLVNESLGRSGVKQRSEELDQRQAEQLQKLLTDVGQMGMGKMPVTTESRGEDSNGREWYRTERKQ